ncbi:hypothetical protein C5S29_15435 [ANME-1 cluster archaeon GoMg3.2]|nr:hypothetical protein [ANME-1 cluster archaeon GoMg3.2]
MEYKFNWTYSLIDDLISDGGIFCDGDWVESKDQDPQGEVRLIQLADIGDGVFKDKSHKFLTLKTSKDLNCTYLEKNDILIARLPDPLGRACLVPFDRNKRYVTAVDVCIVRPNTNYILNKYLLYSINSPIFRVEVDKYKSGTTRKRISRKNLSKIEIPIPPLPEQRAIVAKIEKLLSDLDNGIANLKKAQKQLKIYRQAVLKKAFEGELTRKWRAEQTDLPSAEELLLQIKEEREKHYQKQLDEWEKAVKGWEDKGKAGKKPSRPKKPKELPPLSEAELKELPELPGGGGWSRLGQIIEEPKYGTSKKCSYDVTGKAVLRIPNIGNGIIDKEDLKFASFSDEENEIYKLKGGDILTIRSNGSIALVGKCALIHKQDEEFLYAGYLIRLRPLSIIDSKYLLNCLSSICLRNQIQSKAKSTSGVNNINSGEIKSLIMPICSIQEQHQIVCEIETRLSVCDKMEATIAESLQKSEALRQSILKKAFEGELLSEKELEEARNAPDWEPADKLLERINAEKEKTETKKSF